MSKCPQGKPFKLNLYKEGNIFVGQKFHCLPKTGCSCRWILCCTEQKFNSFNNVCPTSFPKCFKNVFLGQMEIIGIGELL